MARVDQFQSIQLINMQNNTANCTQTTDIINNAINDVKTIISNTATAEIAPLLGLGGAAIIIVIVIIVLVLLGSDILTIVFYALF